MTPDPLFYKLLLLALVWLGVMLHLVWLSERAAARPTLPQPVTPPRQRFKELKPFKGLTQRPHCAACEHDTTHPPAPPPAPPAPMPSTHRRPRTVDTSMHFCPHPGCRYRGWLGLGNLRANGHPNGSSWRQFHCTAQTSP